MDTATPATAPLYVDLPTGLKQELKRIVIARRQAGRPATIRSVVLELLEAGVKRQDAPEGSARRG